MVDNAVFLDQSGPLLITHKSQTNYARRILLAGEEKDIWKILQRKVLSVVDRRKSPSEIPLEGESHFLLAV